MVRKISDELVKALKQQAAPSAIAAPNRNTGKF
jgi:hypothetical protein